MSREILGGILMVGGALLGIFGMPVGWFIAGAGGLIYNSTITTPDQDQTTDPFAGGGSLGQGKVYSWQGAHITAQQGLPVPVVYGTHRVGGNIINVQHEESTIPGEVTYGLAYLDDLSGTMEKTPLTGSSWDTVSSYLNTTLSFTRHCQSNHPYLRFTTDVKVESVEIQFRAMGRFALYVYPSNKSIPYPFTANQRDGTLENNKWLTANAKNGGFAGTVNLKRWSSWQTLKIDGLPRDTYKILFIFDGVKNGKQQLGGGSFCYKYQNYLQIRKIAGLGESPTAAPDSAVSYLHLLQGMSEGPVAGINNIFINEQDLSNYDSSTIEIDTRLGDEDQELISGWEGSVNIDTMNVGIDATGYTYNCAYTNTNELKAQIKAPNGLYSIIDGQYKGFKAIVGVEYKYATGSTWLTGGNVELAGISPKSFSKWWEKKNLTAAQYDIRFTRTSSAPDDEETFGDVYLTEIQETEYGGKKYPFTSLLSMRIKSGRQLSGNIPNITALIRGKEIQVPELLTGASGVLFDECYYDLSGGAYMYGSASLSWDGSSFVTQYSSNPAWCIYDILTAERYGLGAILTAALIDTQSFYDVGTYCDEIVSPTTSDLNDWTGATAELYDKRHELHVVIDTEGQAIDTIDQLLKSFRGFLVWGNGEVKLRADKPEDPVQVFNMGNIVADTFSVQYKPLDQRPNAVELQFLNSDLDYEKDTMLLEDTSRIVSEGTKRLEKLNAFGITKKSQAIRMGRYILNTAEYVQKAIQFEAGLDAIQCEAGDVFVFQHDVPEWNFGGRVGTGSTASHIYLGEEIELGTAGDYKMMVQLTGDTIESHYIDPAISGYVWDVTTTASFSKTPQRNQLWIVGRESVIENEYRALSIDKLENDNYRVFGLQYDERVYSDTGDIAQYDSDFNTIPSGPDIPIPDHVQDLKLVVETDYYSAIVVDWNSPDDARAYKGANVYVKSAVGLSAETDWEFWKRQEVPKTSARYSPIVVNQRYGFKVVAFNEQNYTVNFEGSPTAYITVAVSGSTASDRVIVYEPPIITGLSVE